MSMLRIGVLILMAGANSPPPTDAAEPDVALLTTAEINAIPQVEGTPWNCMPYAWSPEPTAQERVGASEKADDARLTDAQKLWKLRFRQRLDEYYAKVDPHVAAEERRREAEELRERKFWQRVDEYHEKRKREAREFIRLQAGLPPEPPTPHR